MLPYTDSSGGTDVWTVLENVDQHPTDASSIICVYSETPRLKTDHTVDTGWNREHVWCKSYGVGYEGADTSDVHSFRAADCTVNSSRNNRYLDDCTTTDPVCTMGSTEAVNTLRSTGIAGSTGLWTPPPSNKGDLARSMFYMALRYDGDEPFTYQLELSNSPDETIYRIPLSLPSCRSHTFDTH